MPFPETPALPHMRLSWGGDLGDSSQDIWSNSIAWASKGPEALSIGDMDKILDLAVLFLPDLITASGMQVSPAVALKWIKAVWVLGTGKQRDVNTQMREFTSVVPRGTGPASIWSQTYAVTLRTALQRGRGHAGRIFPPVCGPAPEGNTPYAPAAFANTMAQNYGAFLNAMKANSANDSALGATRALVPIILSRGTARNPIPAINEIKTLVVDRVADIQHRRTNRVPRLEGNPFLLPA